MLIICCALLLTSWWFVTSLAHNDAWIILWQLPPKTSVSHWCVSSLCTVKFHRCKCHGEAAANNACLQKQLDSLPMWCCANVRSINSKRGKPWDFSNSLSWVSSQRDEYEKRSLWRITKCIKPPLCCGTGTKHNFLHELPCSYTFWAACFRLFWRHTNVHAYLLIASMNFGETTLFSSHSCIVFPFVWMFIERKTQHGIDANEVFSFVLTRFADEAVSCNNKSPRINWVKVCGCPQGSLHRFCRWTVRHTSSLHCGKCVLLPCGQ